MLVYLSGADQKRRIYSIVKKVMQIVSMTQNGKVLLKIISRILCRTKPCRMIVLVLKRVIVVSCVAVVLLKMWNRLETKADRWKKNEKYGQDIYGFCWKNGSFSEFPSNIFWMIFHFLVNWSPAFRKYSRSPLGSAHRAFSSRPCRKERACFASHRRAVLESDPKGHRK